MTTDDAAIQAEETLIRKARRRLRRHGQVLRITRGQFPQILILDLELNCVIAGPVAFSHAALRAWMEE